jgi:hypothetical protein
MFDEYTDGEVRIEIDTRLRCDVCGTERGPEDPILCRVCGEPVLGEEWTP